MPGIGPSLCTAFDATWERFVTRLAGLDDDEYFWEPVAGCWSIRRTPDGGWTIDGAGGNQPASDPPPITTIAWRIGHIAGMALGGFTNRLFGDGSLTVQDLLLPGHAVDVPEFCQVNYRAWRAGIEGLDEETWWKRLGSRWSPYDESNTVDLALHVLDEVAHHTAEVALLRDLYARRGELT